MSKKKSLLFALPALLSLSTCIFLTRPNMESELPKPLATESKSELEIPCAPENWGITITALEQIGIGNNTKLVFVKIGIENNDSLWGKVNGPITINESQKSVTLSTMDGTRYEYLDTSSLPSEHLSASHRAMYETTGMIQTPLLPPGFVTLGRSINGEFQYYNYAFQISNAQKPASITIGDLQVQCIQPHVIGGNGRPHYRDKTIQLPAKTYNLETEITDVHEAPSARRYPNLIGAELVSADWKESIFITDVRRSGNEIIVIFDFTNFSSHDLTPAFNGYIMGDSRLFICENDCDQRPSQEIVHPGQTAQDLTWTFAVPEQETNLTFVYVYGGNIDLNEVYRANPEG